VVVHQLVRQKHIEPGTFARALSAALDAQYDGDAVAQPVPTRWTITPTWFLAQRVAAQAT